MRGKALRQTIVDAAAVNGAREAKVDQSPATVERSRTFADLSADPLRPAWSVTTQAMVDADQATVTVTQETTRSSLFDRPGLSPTS
jgi:hypothetical protein